MRIRKNKKARIIALCSIVLFLLSVGYAFLETNLNANGTAVIKNKSWNVIFSNVQPTTGSVTPITAPTLNASSTQLSWAVNMNSPGEFYEFTVDVTNAGTAAVMIADTLNTTLTTEQAKYLTYTVTYEDYKPVEQYDKLAAGENDALRIRLEVKADADPQDILNQSESFSLNLSEIYAIANANAIARTKAVKYAVTFDKNHADATGTMADQLILQDRATNLTTNSYEREGYHFTNWTTAANGSGTSYTDGQAVTNLGDTTLYANWAINTYTIAFDANGGTGTMANKSMTYGTASNLTANSFTKSGYTFKNWNTAADGTGTTYTNSQSVNNLSTENGATVTLYAQWKKEVTKYAVQIYGINQDVDSEGNTLGLTFGPATGANYNNAYVTHEYEEITENPGNYNVKIVTHTVAADGSETKTSEYLTNSSGNNVTRTQEQVTARQNISLHNMTWAEIAAVSDKTVFEDCMLCGDTKSVELTLNSTIASGTKQTAYGDGAGALANTINSYYRGWNPSQSQNSYVGTGVTLDSNEKSYGSNAKNAGGYSVSHIRATLIGENTKTNQGYAGNVNLSSDTCLYSCIEDDLKQAITPKKIKYVTGTGASSYTLNDDIADSIWLFSDREMYGTGEYSGNTTEGLGSSGDGYARFSNTESKYYISSYNVSSNTNRVVYNEAGSAGRWWLRSPYLGGTYASRIVSSNGDISYGSARIISGLGFGFCIR